MTAVFTVTRAAFGEQEGYVAGFVVYWGTCAAFSAAVLGRQGIVQAFRDRRPRLGRPAALGLALLLWPAAGAIATRFIPELGQSTLPMLATIGMVALVNSLLEEIAWRGVFVELWPHNVWLGLVWPSVGFGLWHLAPQVIHPSSLGPFAYVGASLALGLSWGWVAWRTGSIRWTTISHLFTDGSGLRNALYFLSG